MDILTGNFFQMLWLDTHSYWNKDHAGNDTGQKQKHSVLSVCRNKLVYARVQRLLPLELYIASFMTEVSPVVTHPFYNLSSILRVCFCTRYVRVFSIAKPDSTLHVIVISTSYNSSSNGLRFSWHFVQVVSKYIPTRPEI